MQRLGGHSTTASVLTPRLGESARPNPWNKFLQELYNDDNAILAWLGQDTVDNGVGEAWNVGFGMPDGDDLFDPGAGSFETDTGSWVAYGNNTIECSTDIAQDGTKSLKVVYVDDASGAYLYFRDAYDLSTDLTVGEVYQCTGYAAVNAGSSVTVNIRDGATERTAATITSTSMASFSHTFIAKSATAAYIRFGGMGAGEIVYIDSITLEKVCTGTFVPYVQDAFFDTASPNPYWTEGTNWNIASGKATHTPGTTVAFQQEGCLTDGIEYETIFKISGRTAGSIYIRLGGTGTGTTRTTNDIFTQRLTSVGANPDRIFFLPSSDFDGSIEFVLVRPVSSYTNGRYAAHNLVLNPYFDTNEWTGDDPDDWAVTEVGDATSNITENPAGHCQIISDGTQTLIRQNILAIGKTYVITIHVATVAAGSIKVTVGSGTTPVTLSSVGVHKIVATATGDSYLYIGRTGACDVTIDYVRVEQILIAPSSSFSSPSSNPLAAALTAVTLDAPGNSKVPRMWEYNGLTSIGNAHSGECNAILPRYVGSVFLVARCDSWAAGIDYLLAFLIDANNGFYIYRTGTNIVIGYDAGGTAEEVTIASGSPTGLFFVGFSYDVADGVIDYYNGSQTGAKQTIAGTMVGNFASTTVCIGDSATTPAGVWDGGLACVIWFDAVKTATEMANYAALLGVV